VIDNFDREIELFQSVGYDQAPEWGRSMVELDFRELIERFDEILDAVARGECFRVLRDGRAIAIMEPSQLRHLGPAETVGSPA